MILNIGCGSKTTEDHRVVNIDWSILVRLKAKPYLRPLYRLVGSSDRFSRLEALPHNILAANIAAGIPFPDSSVDAVYHSHTLEHLDPPDAHTLFLEVLRVLKPGGIHRTVVPDFEYLCQRYLEHAQACETDCRLASEHDAYISDIIEQMVRRLPRGTEQQAVLRRFVELVLLGDARKRGETHQWMYDRHNLSSLYHVSGFCDLALSTYNESSIEGWKAFRLEIDSLNREYKPHSLYVEGKKPVH